MEVMWLATVVSLLCSICSVNTEEKPFFYANNPFLSSEQNDEIRRQQILSTNPFFQNQGPTYAIDIRGGSSTDIACGVSEKMKHLIVKGDEFEEGTYPWMAALFSVKSDGLHFICGGTIISERHILTAAHCVVQDKIIVHPRDLMVALGKFNLRSLAKTDSSVYKVHSVHCHPDYTLKSADGDIAILQLLRKIKFTELVRPVCLWSGSNNLNEIEGQLGTVAGWGKTADGTQSLSRPTETKLPIISQEECLRNNPEFASITSDRTLCAGFKNGAGPCSGDSGGGLVIERDGKYMLRGLASMSMNSNSLLSGCDLKYYVIFTDASKFLPWIDQIIKN